MDRRMRWYLAIMGTCITLIVLAWFVVRLWSTPVAIAMSAVAAFLPPTAAIIANAGRDARRPTPLPDSNHPGGGGPRQR